MDKQPCVYIMTNWKDEVLYVGVTSNLKGRVYQHKHALLRGFTAHYNVKKLVYFEMFGDMYLAICREKQLKAWRRQKKIDLVNQMNPEWRDLYDDL